MNLNIVLILTLIIMKKMNTMEQELRLLQFYVVMVAKQKYVSFISFDCVD